MRSRPRLSIPTRIFLGLTLVLTAFGILSIGSFFQHRRTGETLALLEDGYLPIALAVGEAKATQTVFHTYLDLLMSDPTGTRNWLDAARQLRPAKIRQALESIDAALALDPSPADRALLEESQTRLRTVLEGFEASQAGYDRLYDALAAGEQAGAEEALSDLRSKERETDSLLRDTRAALQTRIAAISADVAAKESQSAILLGILTCLALLVGLFVLWAAHRMLSPLPRLQERVAAVARGDLSEKELPQSDDELGRLAKSFEQMVAALAARDVRLREAADAEIRLKQMQEEIVRNLNAAVIVVDGSGIVRAVNPAAEPVLGLTASAIGLPLEESGLFNRAPRMRQALAQVGADAEQAELTPDEPLAEGAKALHALMTRFPTEDDDESVLVVAEDVTQELRTKKRLIHTERLAAIGRMAAHVTHEVRNPLSSIGLNVEMLEDEVSDDSPEAKALLHSIQREVDRLTGITEEYLRVARLPQPNLEPDDLGQLVESVTAFLRPEMERAGVTFDVSIAPDLPVIAFDELQIRQALLNLIRNARESMPSGGRVGVSVAPASGGLRIQIEDEGSGMTEEQQKRMFELFYTTKKRGSGLGLPLTQQIIVAHGGRVDVESDLGNGTCFELWFPEAGADRAPVGDAAE
ncbi:MAG: ATP-binding protein [Myxococcota bacterium]